MARIVVHGADWCGRALRGVEVSVRGQSLDERLHVHLRSDGQDIDPFAVYTCPAAAAVCALRTQIYDAAALSRWWTHPRAAPKWFCVTVERTPTEDIGKSAPPLHTIEHARHVAAGARLPQLGDRDLLLIADSEALPDVPRVAQLLRAQYRGYVLPRGHWDPSVLKCWTELGKRQADDDMWRKRIRMRTAALDQLTVPGAVAPETWRGDPRVASAPQPFVAGMADLKLTSHAWKVIAVFGDGGDGRFVQDLANNKEMFAMAPACGLEACRYLESRTTVLRYTQGAVKRLDTYLQPYVECTRRILRPDFARGSLAVLVGGRGGRAVGALLARVLRDCRATIGPIEQ